MSWLRRLMGGPTDRDPADRAPDYLAEALELERRGDLANALTSYRLALRERPDDPRILQNIAIAFSRAGQPEEAIRAYRRALDVAPSASGAHYGLGFLLLRRGDEAAAVAHLEAFLRAASDDEPDARFVAHAERTLAALHAAEGAATDADPAEASDAPADTPPTPIRAADVPAAGGVRGGAPPVRDDLRYAAGDRGR